MTTTPKTCGEWIERLRFQIVQMKGSSEETWKGDYWQILKRLPLDEPPTVEALDAVIASVKPNSKQRKRACMAIGALARIAKLDYDPSPYSGKYGLKSVHPRDLVEDSIIVEWFLRLKNPRWRWYFGMLATYGLRPHEGFRLDFDRLRQGDRIVAVERNTKTGERLVWPLHPEWFDEFQLANVQIPSINLNRSNEKVGYSATSYFGDTAKLPFGLYTLRHCWSIRALLYGMPDTIAAQQQGHSVQVHQRLYQRWINIRHHQMVYDSIITKDDRPQPPKIDKGTQPNQTVESKKDPGEECSPGSLSLNVIPPGEFESSGEK